MGILFRIFHFSSVAVLAKDVTDKLNRNEIRAESQMIPSEESFSIRFVKDKRIPCSVLIINKEDLSRVPTLSISESEQIEAYSILIICVGISAKELLGRNYPNVVEVGNSVEAVRIEIIDFYGRITNKSYYDSFVGRVKEIDQFQNLLYSERFISTKAVVVSGHPGVGREAFARECIRLSSEKKKTEPCFLSMGNNGSIELFIIQINSILQVYNEDGMITLLKGNLEEKVDTAVSLLNQLFSFGKYVIVYDDSQSCIRYDRKLADWFKAIISSMSLMGRMHLYVISSISMNYSKAKVLEDIAFFTLYDLSYSDRKKLIYSKLTDYGIAAHEDDVKFILDSSIYSPHMLVRVLDDYYENNSSIAYVKSHMNDYLSIGDNKLRPIINKYRGSKEHDIWNLLILFSKVEYLSESLLESIFSDTYDIVQSHLERFVLDGLVERFGEIGEYFRLDSSISDNLKRNKYKYDDPSFQTNLEEVMSDIISNNPQITEDYSAYLYKVKLDLKKNRPSAEALLIPSIIVSSIVDSYNSTRYSQTIALCDWVLKQNPHYFNDVYREVRYWLCLALARKSNNRFYEEVDYFLHKNNADYHFLNGFMYRMTQKYSKAELEYRNALKQNPSFSRAKRELVIVLLRQHKYSEALALAKENYERDSENSYHLLAYYRCLVKKREHSYEDKQILAQLLKEAEDGIIISDSIKMGMRFEYDRYVENKKPKDLDNEIKTIEATIDVSDSSYLKDIISEYRFSRGDSLTIRFLNLDKELDG